MEKDKKIYVNGGVVIDTPFFCYKNAGCLYADPPEGAEIIECDEEIDAAPCIKITEEKAPSIFNEYYAKTFFSTLYCWAEFLHKDFNQDYEDYLQKMSGIKEVLNLLAIATEKQKQELLLMAYGSVFTALDTFVADTILTKITHDKESFKIYISLLSKKEREKLQNRLNRMWEYNECGDAEQQVINNVLTTSFCNIMRIKDVYQKVFNVSIGDNGGKMKRYFHNRHLIIHRNGKKKDGTNILKSEEEVYVLINDVSSFVKQIVDQINK